MNVDHVSEDSIPKPTPEKDRLALIFERQSALMHRYHSIESENGFRVFIPPMDLNERHAQHKLKEFSWRVTEELTEATQALWDHPDIQQHFLEELSDAFHFLVEMTILSGWNDTQLTQQIFANDKRGENPGQASFDCRLLDIFCIATEDEPLVSVSNGTYRVIQNLGNAMNCLKNKPWKVTHMMTDVPRYFEFMRRAWVAFLQLADIAGLDADSLYKIYYRKSEVNKFRQRTEY